MNANPLFSSNAPQPEQVRSRTAEVLAVAHPLSEEQVAIFGLAFDDELKLLEERFAAFVTQKSLRADLRRSR